VKPGRLTDDPAYDAVRERLKAMHTRRVKMWKCNKAARKLDMFCPLEVVRTPDIVIGPCRHIYVNIEVRDIDDKVQMVSKVIEVVVDPHGGGESFLQRSTYCIVSTGEACPP